MSAEPYTRYLTVYRESADTFSAGVSALAPTAFLQQALENSRDLRYSPIMPAYLTPENAPAGAPEVISSIAFFFHSAPYIALGELKPKLQPGERANVYFTEGLASVLVLNLTKGRALELRKVIGDCGLEYWPVANGTLRHADVLVFAGPQSPAQGAITLPNCEEPDLQVYVEQIAASVSSLWSAYSAYLPEERVTLMRLVEVTADLVTKYAEVKNESGGTGPELIRQKKANSIVSALVELSATLSYAVTQGTSGASPILWNRSPFPHHSLLGIGSSVRALTRFTRYLEVAFMARSAGRVIGK